MYRKLVLKMHWDGEKNPSINVPLGDFSCLGHSIASNFCSLPFPSSTDLHGKFGGGAALNGYLPMPFARHARVELTNEGEWLAGQYSYIDYEVYDRPLDTDNDWASTTYWYQVEPHKPFDLQPIEQRLPIRGDIGVVAAGPEGMPRLRRVQPWSLT